MPYDGKILARAREQLERRRAANQAEQQRRLSAAYARVPEIQQIDMRMRAQMAELVRLTLTHRSDLKERIEALEKENLELQIRRAELLVEQGWPVEFLDEICSCPKCRDTGIYNGAPCDCLHKLYNQELTKELGVLLRSGDESFERFDLSYYSDAPLAGGESARQNMSLVYDACRKFAEKFPQVSSNLLFPCGPAALDAFERQKFSRDAEEAEKAGRRVRQMLSCDLMILDDLGTEMLTPYSSSALYTLINTRLTNGLRIIISTNYSPEELRAHYSPQIFSRLVGEFYFLPFTGTDIRRLKK